MSAESGGVGVTPPTDRQAGYEAEDKRPALDEHYRVEQGAGRHSCRSDELKDDPVSGTDLAWHTCILTGVAEINDEDQRDYAQTTAYQDYNDDVHDGEEAGREELAAIPFGQYQ
ncbi:unnamed protein product [Dibothriocephalus latus]|uniref:Uncharacterized protein n=1 Tax=Dibothriocephalus latus TaxID=60516 RepID=A0A3P6NZ48_DIBLA|nr:unnamed protein product [Dibothriocephalus latus]